MRALTIILSLLCPIYTNASVKIVSYNIKAGLDSSIESIATAIKTMSPDIIALQEVDEKNRRSNGLSQTEIIAKTTGLYSAFCSSTEYRGGFYGHTLLSKHAISNLQKYLLPMIKDKEQRSFCIADVNVGTISKPQNIIIVFAHLGLLDNALHIESLMAVVKSKSKNNQIVILGDLNLTPDSVEYKKLTQNYIDLMPADGRVNTFPTRKPRARIDYMLTPEIKGKSITTEDIMKKYPSINWAKLSDHFPIMVQLN